MSILFVSPTPADAAGLDPIPGVAVRVASPSSFSPKDLASADLAIFEYAVPKEMPPVNTLLVMPPPGDPVFGFNVQPTAKRRDHRMAADRTAHRLGEFPAAQFARRRIFRPASVDPGSSAATAARCCSRASAGPSFRRAGFNPFPYLGRRNLPMSVLTLNAISYLAGFGAETAGYRTGEPWLVPAGVERSCRPSGKRSKSRPGTLFTDANFQGVYELIAADGAKSLARGEPRRPARVGSRKHAARSKSKRPARVRWPRSHRATHQSPATSSWRSSR